jgi:hypothetical protein
MRTLLSILLTPGSSACQWISRPYRSEIIITTRTYIPQKNSPIQGGLLCLLKILKKLHQESVFNGWQIEKSGVNYFDIFV